MGKSKDGVDISDDAGKTGIKMAPEISKGEMLLLSLIAQIIVDYVLTEEV